MVLQALDTLSGFNSQLAVQVNATRQDIRMAKDRLRDESRRNLEAQHSLFEWSREVESDRQLLFEAMAYINDDVQSPVRILVYIALYSIHNETKLTLISSPLPLRCITAS